MRSQRCFKHQAEKDAKEKAYKEELAKEKAYEEVLAKANATNHVSPTPPAKRKKVVEKSEAWKHCTKNPEERTVYCKSCSKSWQCINGSKSNFRRNTINKHYDKLSSEERLA